MTTPNQSIPERLRVITEHFKNPTRLLVGSWKPNPDYRFFPFRPPSRTMVSIILGELTMAAIYMAFFFGLGLPEEGGYPPPRILAKESISQYSEKCFSLQQLARAQVDRTAIGIMIATAILGFLIWLLRRRVIFASLIGVIAFFPACYLAPLATLHELDSIPGTCILGTESCYTQSSGDSVSRNEYPLSTLTQLPQTDNVGNSQQKFGKGII